MSEIVTSSDIRRGYNPEEAALWLMYLVYLPPRSPWWESARLMLRVEVERMKDVN